MEPLCCSQEWDPLTRSRNQSLLVWVLLPDLPISFLISLSNSIYLFSPPSSLPPPSSPLSPALFIYHFINFFDYFTHVADYPLGVVYLSRTSGSSRWSCQLYPVLLFFSFFNFVLLSIF